MPAGEIKIDMTKANKLLEKLYAKAPRIAADTINEAAIDVHRLAVASIMTGYSPPIQDTGSLARSLQFGKNTSQLIDLRKTGRGAVFAVVGSNLPYAPHIEYGTARHHVPLGALVDWAKGRFKGKDYKRIAKIVQEKIAERGTEARPFLFPAYESVASKLPGKIRKELKKLKGL